MTSQKFPFANYTGPWCLVVKVTCRWFWTWLGAITCMSAERTVYVTGVEFWRAVVLFLVVSSSAGWEVGRGDMSHACGHGDIASAWPEMATPRRCPSLSRFLPEPAVSGEGRARTRTEPTDICETPGARRHVCVNLTLKLKVWLKLKRCDKKVRSLWVGKFWCDKKVRSLKKKFGTKLGLTLVRDFWQTKISVR